MSAKKKATQQAAPSDTGAALQEVAAASVAKVDSAPSKVKLVAMKREPEAYPEGPHTADVHPDEVENFTVGGWERA